MSPLRFVDGEPPTSGTGRGRPLAPHIAETLQQLHDNPGRWAILDTGPLDQRDRLRVRHAYLAKVDPTVDVIARRVGDEVIVYGRHTAPAPGGDADPATDDQRLEAMCLGVYGSTAWQAMTPGTRRVVRGEVARERQGEFADPATVLATWP